MKAYIGLDIGGTKILGYLYDEQGQVFAKEKKKTKASKGIETVVEQIKKVIDGLIDEKDIELLGIGAGAPGLIKDEGTIVFSPNIPFTNFDLKEVIEATYDCPFVLGNDVNVAMYGEWRHSDLSSAKSVLGMFVGTGIGGAIILDGKLYLGMGSAAEFGHTVVNNDGVFCGCGSKGCLEAYASKSAMQKFIIAQLKKGRESILSSAIEDGQVIKSSAIYDAYKAKDSLAIDVVNQATKYLGIATANFVNIFHPEVMIFGGGIMESFGHDFLDAIKEEAMLHVMPGLLDDVALMLSELGDDAGVYGGYQLVLTHLEP